MRTRVHLVIEGGGNYFSILCLMQDIWEALECRLPWRIYDLISTIHLKNPQTCQRMNEFNHSLIWPMIKCSLSTLPGLVLVTGTHSPCAWGAYDLARRLGNRGLCTELHCPQWPSWKNDADHVTGHLPDSFFSSNPSLDYAGEGEGPLFRAPLGKLCGLRKRAQAFELDSVRFQHQFCHLLVVWPWVMSPLCFNLFMCKKGTIYIKYIE